MRHADLPAESIRDLVGRLIDSAKAYARAELTLVRQTGLAWVSLAKVSIALLIVALLLVQAALTTLVVALGFLLTRWLDFPLGFATAAVLVLLLAGALAWIAASRFSQDRRP